MRWIIDSLSVLVNISTSWGIVKNIEWILSSRAIRADKTLNGLAFNVSLNRSKEPFQPFWLIGKKNLVYALLLMYLCSETSPPPLYNFFLSNWILSCNNLFPISSWSSRTDELIRPVSLFGIHKQNSSMIVTILSYGCNNYSDNDPNYQKLLVKLQLVSKLLNNWHDKRGFPWDLDSKLIKMFTFRYIFYLLF